MIMFFLYYYYYGSTLRREMGVYMERSRLGWEAMERSRWFHYISYILMFWLVEAEDGRTKFQIISCVYR